MQFPRVRVSIRLLMAVVLVAAGGCGWLVHAARVQRDAAAAILRAGGDVVYDWELNADGSPNPAGKLWWPGWIVDRLGVDYFGTVRQAFLLEREPRLGDEPTQVGHLGQLERLYLCSPRMTDAKLAPIAGLTRLVGLSLQGSDIGDVGLARLRGLRRLQGLNLAGTRVTDAGLIHLRGLRELRSLDLKETGVTDAGVALLRRDLPDLIVHR